MAKKLRVVSLFSGCGGLDLGFLGGFVHLGMKFARNNIEILFANDIDPDIATCYNANTKLLKGKCLCADIRTVPLSEIPDFDILTAGFPCQPFSNAGNRKGVNDDNGRGTLFEMCEAVIKDKCARKNRTLHPKAFVFENVRGIMSSKMPDGETTVPDEIKKRMERLGYKVSIDLVCASDYGVPQNRYRVLIVGIRKDLVGQFDFKQRMEQVVRAYKLPSVSYGKKEKLLLGYLLNDLPREEKESAFWEYSATTQNMVDNIGPCQHGMSALELFKGDFSIENLPQSVFEGRSWKNVPREKMAARFKKIYDNPKKYHAPKFFRRFAFGEIVGTMTASAQPENCGITHPVENRRFTIREAARIQSFPDNYHFAVVSIQSQYKVIGNAVPPVLGWVIARALTGLLKEVE